MLYTISISWLGSPKKSKKLSDLPIIWGALEQTLQYPRFDFYQSDEYSFHLKNTNCGFQDFNYINKLCYDFSTTIFILHRASVLLNLRTAFSLPHVPVLNWTFAITKLTKAWSIRKSCLKIIQA